MVFALTTVPDDNAYDSTRRVAFGNAAGSFVLRGNRDVELIAPSDALKPEEPPAGYERLGNQSILRAGGNTAELAASGKLTVDHNFGSELLLTRATIAPKAVQGAAPSAWHLQDATGQYYVQPPRGNDVWQTWPDGQDFVSSYFDLVSVSPFALLTPGTQAQTRNGTPAVAPPAGLATTDPAISFETTRPYSRYNWELFLHSPLAIASYLAAQQHFVDARAWLHTVFDPTIKPRPSGGLEFWRFVRFSNSAKPETIANRLKWLAVPGVDSTDADVGSEIDAWKRDPFTPHVIARMRPSAYQWYTFFAYIDLLIGWGDQLFRRDTRESINDATQLYVLAAKLLGPRPRSIAAATPVPAQTYRSLTAGNGLDAFGNEWVEWADLPGTQVLSGTTQRASGQYAATAATGNGSPVSIGRATGIPFARDKSLTGKHQTLTTLAALAFCIPPNEKLTGFHDRLEERLFRVRNCQNIDGVSRALPLFEPAIDPLLLIRAKAAGLDLDAIVAGQGSASQSRQLPTHRFNFTLQKAIELTSELKSLGGALLSALERQDAEELTLLRSSQELAMQKLVRDIRERQIDDAEANIVALQQSEATVTERFGQYQRLLGKTAVTKGADGLPVVEQSSSLAISTDSIGGANTLGLSRLEVDQLLLGAVSHLFMQAANASNVAGAVLAAIPNVWVGSVVAGQTFGGSNLGSAASAVAKSIEMGGAAASYLAGAAGTFAGYERRQDEWVHQSKLALAELKQLEQQILAAEIRKAIAELELRNHDQQAENALQADEFMRGKFTNKELFRWMSAQISDVYFRSYQLALDQARRAERAYRRDLGLGDQKTTFIQAGYWDSLKKGLVAGDQLHHDLRRMEVAYLEQNVREFEITKHVSLASIDPLSLMQLKLSEEHECTIHLPETLFDLDHPGHYLRRLKTVSVTIPCVTGPYASVNCTLELHRSEIRHNTELNGQYARVGEDLTRFTDQYGTIQAIVTSSAQNDSGLFETSLRDERYLPFEGAGAISTWRMRLPKDFKQFDYEAISDVIMHLRYTARDGGPDLRAAATDALKTALETFPGEVAGRPLALLVSLRHDFPSEWARFVGPGEPDDDMRTETFAIDKSRFPAVLGDRELTVEQVDLFVSSAKDLPPADPILKPPNAASAKALPLNRVLELGTVGTVRQLSTYDALGPTPAVVVADDVEDSQWAITASAALRAAVRDVVLVFTYTATTTP